MERMCGDWPVSKTNAQVEALHDVMLMVGVHGADLTNLIFLPTMAAVVEIGVECEVEGASVDSPFWRGPGTLMNHSILGPCEGNLERATAARRMVGTQLTIHSCPVIPTLKSHLENDNLKISQEIES